MLRNADEKTTSRLSAEFPQAEKQHKDEMYEKVRKRMNSSESIFAEEVSGVEKYTRRPLWKVVPMAVMSLVLVCGAVGGGAMMLKNSSMLPSAEIETTTDASDNNEENAETTPDITQETTTGEDENITTENTTVSTEAVQDTETTAVQANDTINITKEEIYAICEKGQTANFDKISFTCEHREDYTTGYHMDHNIEVIVDNTLNAASKTALLGYYRDDESIVYEDRETDCTYNNITSTIFNSSSPDFTDKENNKTIFSNDEVDNLNCFINEDSDKAQDLLQNLNSWDITGTEEYLGRKCAIVSGTSDIPIFYDGDTEPSDICSCEFTLSIDIETGIWMRCDIKDTSFDHAHFTSAITEIAFGDAAKTPMSQSEFRQLVIDKNCVREICNTDTGTLTYPPVTDAELEYLK